MSVTSSAPALFGQWLGTFRDPTFLYTSISLNLGQQSSDLEFFARKAEVLLERIEAAARIKIAIEARNLKQTIW